MIKIFLPEINNKFYNAMQNLRDDRYMTYSIHPVDIYNIHYQINADVYIFDASYVSNEILQFINEYSEVSVKTYIYHSYTSLNKDMLKYIKKSKHIVPYNLFEEYKVYKNIIQFPEYIINDKIFYKSNFEQRIDRVAYFLDSDNEIPTNIQNNLYPNTKDSKLLLFNNSKISHPQNLGLLSELDKAKILNEYQYFMCNKYNEYIAEAITCGCDLVDNNLNKVEKDNLDITTFQKFIRDIL